MVIFRKVSKYTINFILFPSPETEKKQQKSQMGIKNLIHLGQKSEKYKYPLSVQGIDRGA